MSSQDTAEDVLGNVDGEVETAVILGEVQVEGWEDKVHELPGCRAASRASTTVGFVDEVDEELETIASPVAILRFLGASTMRTRPLALQIKAGSRTLLRPTRSRSSWISLKRARRSPRIGCKHPSPGMAVRVEPLDADAVVRDELAVTIATDATVEHEEDEFFERSVALRRFEASTTLTRPWALQTNAGSSTRFKP